MNNLNAINNLTRSGEWAISDRGFMNFLTRDREAASQHLKQSPEAYHNPDKVEHIREMLSLYYNQRQPMEVEMGFAFIYVYGALLTDASPIDLGMGSTDYAEIISDIEAAEMNDAIDTVIFCVDSPGGMVSGMLEVVNAIRDMNKRTVGYVLGHATSAAYALLSQCGFVAASASSTSGNIGTVLKWSDMSKMFEMMGITENVMTNEGATLKSTFHESPMSEEQKTFLQARITQLGEEFWDLVKAARPQVSDECKLAGWYQPEDAGRLGLIDMTSTKVELITYLSENIDTLQA